MQSSFKEYMDRLIQQRLKNDTKNNVNQNIKTFSLISSMLELYIPRVGDIFTSIGSKPSIHENIKNDK